MTPWYKKLWHLIVYPYEEWRHRVFMQGWNAGYDDCERRYGPERISTLRTGIKMALRDLEPSLLTAEQKIELTVKSLEALLDSDLDKVLK